MTKCLVPVNTAVAGLVERAKEVATKLDPQMSRRLANLLDVALDCQDRGIGFQPKLTTISPEPGLVAKLRELARAHKDKGRTVVLVIDGNDTVELIF